MLVFWGYAQTFRPEIAPFFLPPKKIMVFLFLGKEKHLYFAFILFISEVFRYVHLLTALLSD